MQGARSEEDVVAITVDPQSDLHQFRGVGSDELSAILFSNPRGEAGG